MKTTLLLSVAMLATVAFTTSHADESSAELDRIKAERQAVDARFMAAQAACQSRFAVNDCVDRARRERRDALADLRRQEVSINDAGRKRKAAQRLREIEDRSEAEGERAARERRGQAVRDQKEREARATEKAQVKAARDADAARRAQSSKPADPTEALGPQPTASEAASRRAEYEQRLEEARERKEKARQRTASRSKPAASALPVPP